MPSAKKATFLKIGSGTLALLLGLILGLSLFEKDPPAPAGPPKMVVVGCQNQFGPLISLRVIDGQAQLTNYGFNVQTQDGELDFHTGPLVICTITDAAEQGDEI
jgi:hypothetical protein